MGPILKQGPQSAFTMGYVSPKAIAFAKRLARQAERARINEASNKLRIRYLRYCNGFKSEGQAWNALGIGLTFPHNFSCGGQRLAEKWHTALDRALTERGF